MYCCLAVLVDVYRILLRYTRCKYVPVSTDTNLVRTAVAVPHREVYQVRLYQYSSTGTRYST